MQHFLTHSAHELQRRFTTIAPETLGILDRYPWPGNVRELRAVIGRAVLLHDDDCLRSEHLPTELIAAALAAPAVATVEGDTPPTIPTLEDVELAHIRRVLDICGGNRTLAAHHLGISRQTLTKRLGGTGDEP